MTHPRPLAPKSPSSAAGGSRRRSPSPPGTLPGAASRGAPTPGKGTGAATPPAPRHRPQPAVSLAQAGFVSGFASPKGPWVLLTPSPPHPEQCRVLLEEQLGATLHSAMPLFLLLPWRGVVSHTAPKPKRQRLEAVKKLDFGTDDELAPDVLQDAGPEAPTTLQTAGLATLNPIFSKGEGRLFSLAPAKRTWCSPAQTAWR